MHTSAGQILKDLELLQSCSVCRVFWTSCLASAHRPINELLADNNTVCKHNVMVLARLGCVQRSALALVEQVFSKGTPSGELCAADSKRLPMRRMQHTLVDVGSMACLLHCETAIWCYSLRTTGLNRQYRDHVGHGRARTTIADLWLTTFEENN